MEDLPVTYEIDTQRYCITAKTVEELQEKINQLIENDSQLAAIVSTVYILEVTRIT